jgi:iron(III) transport system substrate-binding protein
MEWLVGEKAQHLYADMNYEYPLLSEVKINPTIAAYGTLKPDSLPLAEVAKHKKAAANLVDKVGFDN